jgi:hypothetical protein
MKWTFLILIYVIGIQSDIIRNDISEVVTDTNNSIQWIDQSSNIGQNLSWVAAINHCESLTTNGYGDWHLPNIKELLSIIDLTKTSAPLVHNSFENVTAGWFWSSTSKPEANEAFFIDFGGDNREITNLDPKTNANKNALCVRNN